LYNLKTIENIKKLKLKNNTTISRTNDRVINIKYLLLLIKNTKRRGGGSIKIKYNNIKKKKLNKQ